MHAAVGVMSRGSDAVIGNVYVGGSMKNVKKEKYRLKRTNDLDWNSIIDANYYSE